MLGATQAGMAFCNSSVALVHGMSRPIGARFHVPHGLSNAMLLPAVTRFGLEAAPARYAAAARAAGFAAAGDDDAAAGGALCQGLDALNRDLGVPSPQAYGIAWPAWEAAWTRWPTRRSPPAARRTTRACPTRREIMTLYRQVFAGSNA